MDPVVLIDTIVTQPGEENTIKLYEVPRGYKLKISRVAVYFPRGSGGKVKVAIMRGNIKAYPDNGYFSGDGYPVESFIEKEFIDPDEINLYYKNEDDIEQLFTYVIEGYVEKR